jgi:hypothetical protein
MGLLVTASSSRYEIGSLAAMGPGFMPFVLGTLLAVVGLAMIALAAPGTSAGTKAAGISVRGMACILAGVVSFAVLGELSGLVPASFCAVFVAALGERSNSLRDAAVLASVATVVSVVVFAYGLNLQLPLFSGG